MRTSFARASSSLLAPPPSRPSSNGRHHGRPRSHPPTPNIRIRREDAGPIKRHPPTREYSQGIRFPPPSQRTPRFTTDSQPRAPSRYSMARRGWIGFLPVLVGDCLDAPPVWSMAHRSVSIWFESACFDVRVRVSTSCCSDGKARRVALERRGGRKQPAAKDQRRAGHGTVQVPTVERPKLLATNAGAWMHERTWTCWHGKRRGC